MFSTPPIPTLTLRPFEASARRIKSKLQGLPDLSHDGGLLPSPTLRSVLSSLTLSEVVAPCTGC